MISRVIAWRKNRVQRTVDELYALRKKIEPGFIHHDEAYQHVLQQKNSDWWLDLGCGRNAFVEEYRDNFDFCAGYDQDPRLAGSAALPLVLGNADALSIKSNSLDLVSSFYAAEHFNNVHAVLSEIHRVLKPGGVFLCLTTDRHYWASRFNRLLPEPVKRLVLGAATGQKNEDIFKALYRFNDIDTIRDSLTEHGFTQIVLQRHKGYYHFSRLFFYVQHFLNKHTFLGKTQLFWSSVLAYARKKSAGQDLMEPEASRSLAQSW